ncbi:hypothetical protein N836_31725 [Leptolyngbya sp. Heron Island J]|uniref:hypothetical protein n=1 Tax=Leptolyngbya sp. Heron Island J TaxID=1385935 RepID=UPI0003B96579|nr:hypothetical protein [Leptolyngbya sp. Heron Island J]ESA38512.1 hypothetical protein N836_31725 [Leptolyngbya sp. Heron Island J]
MKHIHPPTECDRALKEKVITDGDIAKSVSWYEQNWERISIRLITSLTIEGVTYTQRWQEIFDYKTLPAWRSGQLKGLAVAYVYLTLRQLCRGLRERASP